MLTELCCPARRALIGRRIRRASLVRSGTPTAWVQIKALPGPCRRGTRLIRTRTARTPHRAEAPDAFTASRDEANTSVSRRNDATNTNIESEQAEFAVSTRRRRDTEQPIRHTEQNSSLRVASVGSAGSASILRRRRTTNAKGTTTRP